MRVSKRSPKKVIILKEEKETKNRFSLIMIFGALAWVKTLDAWLSMYNLQAVTKSTKEYNDAVS